MAAIMFTDLAGYSALVRRDEALALEILERHFRMVRARLPGYGGREIKTIGDAFMVEFPSALQAVRCALSMQQAQARYNEEAASTERFEIRIGIHMGDVEVRGGDVFGDGVNIAARIEPHAPRGGIAVSPAVHDAVRSRILVPFASQGTKALKNVSDAFEIFELDQIAIRNLPAEADPQALAPPDGRPRRRRRPWALAGIAAVFAGLSALLIQSGTSAPAPPATRALADIKDQSLAVLPLSSLSANPDDLYFADGLHDTLLTELARIRDMRVISRTSVLRYRDTTLDLREIGAELGVRYLVEGSVQHVGNRLRVNAQLIDSQNNSHVWAEFYDREMEDVFALQGDMARQISAAVKTRITPEEARQIGQGGTRNPQALDAYLRASALSKGFDNAVAQQGLELARRAVALDPEFAQAQAMVAIFASRLFYRGVDVSSAARELAKRAADAAMRSAPELGESHFARAVYLQYVQQDMPAALSAFESAATRLPGDSRILSNQAMLMARLGRYAAALSGMQEVAKLDPLNDSSVLTLIELQYMLRQHNDALATLALAQTRFPELQQRLSLYSNYIGFSATGDRDALSDFLDRWTVPEQDPGCNYAGFRYELALPLERYDVAIAAIDSCKDDFVGQSGGGRLPTSFFKAQAEHTRHATDASVPWLNQAKSEMMALLEQNPGNAHQHAYLSLILAYLGETEAALAHADQARLLMPHSVDAILAAQVQSVTALARAHAGSKDEALADLKQALVTPWGLDAQFVRIDPVWAPLHSEPRFLQLLAMAN